jgi:hypothetical protein
MKFEVTNPKAWKAVNEKNMPMSHKIKVYEKLGGAYRLGESGGEQVFNKMTELLKHRISEGDENSPEETVAGLKEMTMGDLERIADYANMIAKRLQEGQELDSWMYSQLTIALENLNSVHDAMDGNDGEREPMKEETSFFSKLKKGSNVVGKFPPYKEFTVVSTDGKKSASLKDLKTGKTIDVYSTNNYKLKD